MKWFGMFLTVALVFSSATAWAQGRPMCAPRGVIAEKLKTQFSESPTAFGLNNKGVIVELFRTRDGATWTILLTRPDGVSCVAAAGEGWVTRKTEPVGDPA